MREFSPEELTPEYLGRRMAHCFWEEFCELEDSMKVKCIESIPKDIKYLKNLRPSVRYRLMNQIGAFPNQSDKIAYSSAPEDYQSRALLEALIKYTGGPSVEGWTKMTKKQLISELVKMKVELDSRESREVVSELRQSNSELCACNADLKQKCSEMEKQLSGTNAELNSERAAHRALVKLVNWLQG